MEKQENIGALWERRLANGSTFLSGFVTDKDGQRINIICFTNKFQKSEKQPRYNILPSSNDKKPQQASVEEPF